MYYDSPEDTTPSRIETEEIPKGIEYPIEDEDPYIMKEWALIEDITPGIPEDYPVWEDEQCINVLQSTSKVDTINKKVLPKLQDG